MSWFVASGWLAVRELGMSRRLHDSDGLDDTRAPQLVEHHRLREDLALLLHVGLDAPDEGDLYTK